MYTPRLGLGSSLPAPSLWDHPGQTFSSFYAIPICKDSDFLCKVFVKMPFHLNAQTPSSTLFTSERKLSWLGDLLKENKESVSEL